MSGSDGLSISERELLLALGAGPLDVDQLAAELGAAPVVVAAELQALSQAGLVHGVTVLGGRQAWGLTVRGRSRIAEWRSS